MWVGFIVASRPCSKRFSPGTPVFPSPKNQTRPNSNFDTESECYRFVSRNKLLSVTLVKQS